MTGRPKGVKNSRPQHIWSDEEKNFLAEVAPGRGYKEITELMNQKFEYQFTNGQISSALKRMGVSTGRTGRFEKGNIPYNKGTKGIAKPNSGSFKKGQKATNWRPVGSERINKDGYIEVKVSDDGRKQDMWKLKHRVVYEEHNGPIPKGSAIIFGDGDKLNLSHDNLILITRSQLAILNKNGLRQEDIELTKTAINVVDLMLQIGKLKKKR